MTENLQTGRLRLQKPSHAHAQALALLGNNRAITDKLATMPYPYGLNDAISWIDAVDNMQSGSAFLVFLQETDTLIGCCGSGPVDDKDEIDFGYWIGENYWGKGFATEAGQAVLDHVFEKDNFDLITTDCQIDNAASLRVLEKLGFKKVGHRTRFSASTGTQMQTIKVQLSFDEWRQSRQQRTEARS